MLQTAVRKVKDFEAGAGGGGGVAPASPAKGRKRKATDDDDRTPTPSPKKRAPKTKKQDVKEEGGKDATVDEEQPGDSGGMHMVMLPKPCSCSLVYRSDRQGGGCLGCAPREYQIMGP